MKTFVKEVEGFNIYFEALQEDIPIQDMVDDTVIDVNELIEKIDNGEMEYFTAKVTAEKSGVELANDYLGACIYTSYEDFYTMRGCYFDDMVSTVVQEAKEELPQLIKGLTT